MSKYSELKNSCCKANLDLPGLGLVIFTFGNVSVVDRHLNCFAIKPSGIPYESLRPEDIVIVDFNNKVLEGALNPSSDTETHALLYKTWPAIGSIVHTHSTYAVAWAQAQKDIPILGTTHADHLAFDIPCTQEMSDEMIKGNYERETGHQIIKEMQDRNHKPEELEMILVSNHGPFTWGKTAEKAVYNSVMLEELAKMAFITLQINKDAPGLKELLIRKHFERKHGKNAYYGQK